MCILLTLLLVFFSNPGQHLARLRLLSYKSTFCNALFPYYPILMHNYLKFSFYIMYKQYKIYKWNWTSAYAATPKWQVHRNKKYPTGRTKNMWRFLKNKEKIRRLHNSMLDSKNNPLIQKLSLSQIKLSLFHENIIFTISASEIVHGIWGIKTQ